MKTFREHPIVSAVAVLTLAFMWLPLFVVIINSLNADPLLVHWGGFTLDWFRQAAADEAVRSGLVASLEIAASTTLIALALALTGMLWWRRASGRGRRVYDGLVYARIILPEVVFGMALFLVFTRLTMQLGLLTVVVGHSVWGSAYATVILQARVRLLDEAVEEAAADLYATPRVVLARVTMPQLGPGLLAAGVLVFALSFDDVVTSFFLAGSSVNTLPLFVFGLIRFHVTPEVNAIGALVTLSMITLTLIAVWLLMRLVRGPGSIASRLGF
jgi:spermidine/putrescine transport system permease protein